MTGLDHFEVTQCGWQDIKIQLTAIFALNRYDFTYGINLYLLSQNKRNKIGNHMHVPVAAIICWTRSVHVQDGFNHCYCEE